MSEVTLEQALEFIESIGYSEETVKEYAQSGGNYWFNKMKEIADDFGGCQNLRYKVENEGTGYFYYGYGDLTHIPYHIYKSYVDDEECWCEECDEED